jgi:hypothetical protein
MNTQITVGINLTSKEILDLRCAVTDASNKWLYKYEHETDKVDKATYLRIVDQHHELHNKLCSWFNVQKEIENNARS